MHRIIDWNELWKAIHIRSPEHIEKIRDPAAVWNKRAAAYRRATRGEKRATEQELAILDLAAGETVLDVGAGTGRLAVPIARTAAHVTALGPSGGMLSVLRERMAEEGCTNYSCVRLRWEDAVIGRDIEPHDVAVAAFSIGFYDSPEEAARTWAAMHSPDLADLSAVLDYFDRALSRNETGEYVETTVRPTAAVWWEKDDRWPVDSDQRRRALHRPQSLHLRGTPQP